MNSRTDLAVRLFSFLIASTYTMYIRLLGEFTETQPIFCLSFSLLLILTALCRGKIHFARDMQWTLLLLVVLLLSTAITMIQQGPGILIEFLKYLIGPIVFLAIRPMGTKYWGLVAPLASAFLLVAGLLQAASIPFVTSLINGLVARSGGGQTGIRSLVALIPEPSYFCYFAILSLIVADVAFLENTISKVHLYFVRITMLALSLASLSALSFLVALVYFTPLVLEKKLGVPLLILGGMVFIILTGVTMAVPQVRFASVSRSLQELLSGKISLEFLFYAVEPSGSTRIMLNWIGLSGIILSPLGAGIGSFSSIWQSRAEQLGVDIARHPVLRLMISQKVYAQTYLANLVNDIGIMSIVVFPILFSNNRREPQWRRIRNVVVLSSILIFFFQGQITNPVPWILMALVKNPLRSDSKIPDGIRVTHATGVSA